MKNSPYTALHCTLEDIANHEYLLLADHDKDEHMLHGGDRQISLQWPSEKGQSQSHGQDQKLPLLHFWLTQRRAALDSAEQGLLPGAVVTSSPSSLKLLLMGMGLVSGFGLVTNLLQYEGQLPTNVSYYFLCVILVQIALLLLALSTSLLSKIRLAQVWQQRLGISASCLQPFVYWLGQKMYASGLAPLSEEKRRHYATRMHVLVTRWLLYRQSIRWHLAAVVQWFDLTFNVGVLLTFAALIVFSDRAFGWQTSLGFASESGVYQLCRALAVPWSWLFAEGIGFPTFQRAGALVRLLLSFELTAMDILPVDFS